MAAITALPLEKEEEGLCAETENESTAVCLLVEWDAESQGMLFSNQQDLFAAGPSPGAPFLTSTFSLFSTSSAVPAPLCAGSAVKPISRVIWVRNPR